MRLRNTDAAYGQIAIATHWLIAVLIVGLLVMGLIFEDMPDGPERAQLAALHASFGICVLVLTLWRVVWRASEQRPRPVPGSRPWEERLAGWMHLSLIALALVMPLAGIVGTLFGGHELAVFGYRLIPAAGKVEWVSDAAFAVHGVVANVLMILILVHVAAALKHHLLDRDATLVRMLGRTSR